MGTQLSKREEKLTGLVAEMREQVRSSRAEADDERAKRTTTEAEMRVVVALLDEERTKSQVRVKQLGALFQDFAATAYNT